MKLFIKICALILVLFLYMIASFFYVVESLSGELKKFFEELVDIIINSVDD